MWNIATVAQGTTVKRRITLANTGFGPLQTWVDTPVGLTISAAGVSSVAPGDSAVYDLALNTQLLPVGPYSQTIAIRTSDPSMGSPVLMVTGTITSPPSDVPQGALQYPLDFDANITGTHTAGEWVQFTHDRGPTPQTLHPVKVLSANRSTLHGVGNHATEFGVGTAPSDMFGDGHHGDLIVSSSQTAYADDYRTSVSGTAAASQPVVGVASVNALGVWPMDRVLIHQSRGSGSGTWELGTIESVGTTTITLTNDLNHTYTDGGNSQAQVIHVLQHTSCMIAAGGTLTAHAWDGNTGGILAVMCGSGAQISGTVTMNEKGFVGGTTHTGTNAGRGRQGEGTVGPAGSESSAANGNGGGGGDGNAGTGGGSDGAGGGGGGNGTTGIAGLPANNNSQGGSGGIIVGSSDLAVVAFGGGGGGGGLDDGLSQSNAPGGTGGGIIFVSGQSVAITGTVTSNGGAGASQAQTYGGAGGGGAGGSILVRARSASLGSNLITAAGGSGGAGAPENCCDDVAGSGGAGGSGRIRVEYCEDNVGTTSPAASAQQISCHLAEQLETPPYSTTLLNLPESFTSGRHYWIQYGRRLTYSASGQQPAPLRDLAGAASSAVMDVLVSGVPANSSVNAKLSIGDHPAWDWDGTLTANSSGAVTFTTPDLAAAFSAYWASQGVAPPANLDVPIRVYLNQPGQVLLTNLQTTASPSKLRKVRLAARTYTTVNVDLTVGASGSGPLRLYADVGDNGTVDWVSAITVSFPAQLTSPNLAAAFNAYLSGQSGEVDVPVRFYVTPDQAVNVTDFTAVSTAQPDVSVTAGDISFSSLAPVEGDPITVTATLHNLGTNFSGPVTAAFYGTLSDGREWYIGSALVSDIAPGGTSNATIVWQTAGFYGDDLPVRVAVDPYDRVDEAVEVNNTASKTITLLFNSDLHLSPISNVRVSNVEDGRFVVSWLTDVPLDGRAKVYIGGGAVRTFEDNRGSATLAKTHYVTVKGLQPNANYTFDVLSDQFVDHNQTQHYSVTTGPALSPRPVDTARGRVLMPDGLTPIPQAVVHITLQDHDDQGSSGAAAVLSTLTNANGVWSVNLATARQNGLAVPYGYSLSGDRLRVEAITEPRSSGCLIVDTADDSPTPDLVLGASVCSREQTMTVLGGWNLIALPVEPGPALSAERLCTAINSQGGSAVEVDRWRDSGWDGHVCGQPFGDFGIELGQSYLVKATADSTWQITGTVWASSVPVPLGVGWSPLAVVHTPRYTAESLCAELSRNGADVIEIDRWFQGAWEGNVCGLALADFPIVPGEGYLVRSTRKGSARPAAVPPEPSVGNGVATDSQVRPLAATVESKGDDSLIVSNVRDQAATISWRSDRSGVGSVRFGPSPALGRTAYMTVASLSGLICTT